MRLPSGLKMKEQLQARLRLWLFYCQNNRWVRRFYLVVFLLAVVSLAYYGGHAIEKKAYHDLSGAIALLVQKLGVTVSHQDSPYAHLAMVNREMDILNKKIEQLKHSEVENLSKLKELQEQLYFYKSVIAPEELQKGISIFSVHVLKPVREENDYPIEIVLRKGNKKGLISRGKVEVIVYGESREGSDKENKVINLEAMDFSFKYFQRLIGEVKIPPHFVPRELKIIVVSSHAKPVIRAYSWKAVTSKLLLSGN